MKERNDTITPLPPSLGVWEGKRQTERRGGGLRKSCGDSGGSGCPHGETSASLLALWHHMHHTIVSQADRKRENTSSCSWRHCRNILFWWWRHNESASHHMRLKLPQLNATPLKPPAWSHCTLMQHWEHFAQLSKRHGKTFLPIHEIFLAL